MKHLDTYNLSQTALIINVPCGITYSTQVNYLGAHLRKDYEGALFPISSVLFDEPCPLARDIRRHVHDDAVWGEWSVSVVKKINEIFLERYALPLALDPEKLNESGPMWFHVRIIDAKGCTFDLNRLKDFIGHEAVLIYL